MTMRQPRLRQPGEDFLFSDEQYEQTQIVFFPCDSNCLARVLLNDPSLCVHLMRPGLLTLTR